jgi:biopolymer transport protein ExbD
MKLPQTSNDDSLELKMTPMIDVVFLLLVFFVWTSSFELPEFDLPGSLAELPMGAAETSTDTPPVEKFDEIIIRLLWQGEETQIMLNGQEMEQMSDLKARLAEITSLGVQPPVIVDPDEKVTMDLAVQAYDAARAAGVDRVLFAAKPE